MSSNITNIIGNNQDKQGFLETPPKPQEVKIPLHLKLVTGAIAGIIGTCCIFPIDTIKTRLQGSVGLYSSPIHCAKDLLQKEGIGGFYKGLGANLVGVTPEKAIKLAANDVIREYFTDPHTGEIKIHHEIIAGASAGFCQVIATNPMEIIKIRMQMQSLKPVAERQSTLEVVSHLGVSGAYQGTASTLLRDIPFSLIIFPLYANLRKAFADSKTGETSFMGNLVSGCLSAGIGAAAATPMDVLKTRLQVSGAKDRYGSGLSAITKCTADIWSEGGMGAFFRGVVPRVGVVSPLFGIALVAFEIQKSMMKKNMQK